MKHSFLLLLVLQLFISTLVAAEDGPAKPALARPSSALSLTGSHSEITALSDEEEDDDEVRGATFKSFPQRADHLSDSESELEPLPEILYLVKLKKKESAITIKKLSAEATSRLLAKQDDYLGKKHKRVTGAKKTFATSKTLAQKAKTPYELLEHKVAEQAALVAAATKKLEELQANKSEAQERYEEAKKAALKHHQEAQKEVDEYNAAVGLRDQTYEIIYEKAEEANPILALARKTKEKEKADKEREEHQRIQAEWQTVEMEEVPEFGEDKSATASGVEEEGSGWLDTAGEALGYAGSTLGALGNGICTVAHIVGDRVLPDPRRK